MQKAFERVLGGEYTIVIEEELSELKQSDRVLFGEPCAVLYRTDINLGRPADECDTEDKSCYIVFLPSKYSIVCNKDFGAFKSKDGSIKLVSLNYFIEKLLEFNFTFLQLVEDKAVIWETEEFHNIIEMFKDTISSKQNFEVMRYSTLVSIAISIYNDIKTGKIKDENSCNNRLFLLYIVCEACVNIIVTNKFSLNNIFDKARYDRVKNQYTSNKDMSLLNNVINEIKTNKLNLEERDKSYERLCRLTLKYELMLDITKRILDVESEEV